MLKSNIFTKAVILSFLISPTIAFSQSVVQGFGNDIPLSFAVDQVVPDNYVVSYGVGVNLEKDVSWMGGKEWTVVLDQLMYDSGYVASFNGDQILITLDPKNRPKLNTGLSIVEYTGGVNPVREDSYASNIMGDKPGFILHDENHLPPEEKKDTGFAIYPHNEQDKVEPTNPALPDTVYVGVEPPVKISSETTWEVYAGATMEDLLLEWGEQSGWKVIWNSEYSYPIEASAVFNGDFVSAASTLIKAMRNATPPVKGEFYKGNRVLVVETEIDGQN